MKNREIADWTAHDLSDLGNRLTQRLYDNAHPEVASDVAQALYDLRKRVLAELAPPPSMPGFYRFTKTRGRGFTLSLLCDASDLSEEARDALADLLLDVRSYVLSPPRKDGTVGPDDKPVEAPE